MLLGYCRIELKSSSVATTGECTPKGYASDSSLLELLIKFPKTRQEFELEKHFYECTEKGPLSKPRLYASASQTDTDVGILLFELSDMYELCSSEDGFLLAGELPHTLCGSL